MLIAAYVIWVDHVVVLGLENHGHSNICESNDAAQI